MKKRKLRVEEADFSVDFDVDETCSTEATDSMTLLDDFWPISKDGINFKVYVNGYGSSITSPDKAFDDDFSTQFHTGMLKLGSPQKFFKFFFRLF